MPISFSLRQVTSVVEGPLYRVLNEVISATSASTAIFVFKVVTQTFSHYATAADVEAYPDNLSDAMDADLPYYRKTSVTRDWSTVALMNSDLSLTKSRVRLLATELNAQQGALASDVVTVIEGA